MTSIQLKIRAFENNICALLQHLNEKLIIYIYIYIYNCDVDF